MLGLRIRSAVPIYLAFLLECARGVIFLSTEASTVPVAAAGWPEATTESIGGVVGSGSVFIGSNADTASTIVDATDYMFTTAEITATATTSSHVEANPTTTQVFGSEYDGSNPDAVNATMEAAADMLTTTGVTTTAATESSPVEATLTTAQVTGPAFGGSDTDTVNATEGVADHTIATTAATSMTTASSQVGASPTTALDSGSAFGGSNNDTVNATEGIADHMTATVLETSTTTASSPVEATLTTAQVTGSAFGGSNNDTVNATEGIADRTTATALETSTTAASSQVGESPTTAQITGSAFGGSNNDTVNATEGIADYTTATASETSTTAASSQVEESPTTVQDLWSYTISSTPAVSDSWATTIATEVQLPSTVRRTTGAWSSWSDCDRTCDGGTQTKVCDGNATTPADLSGYCESATELTQLCNTIICQVDNAEASSGVYVVLRTSLELEQYVQIRNHIHEAVGRGIIDFCNASVNYAICCPSQPPSSFQPQTRTELDSVIVKRATPRYNDSTSMTLFVALTSAASDELCNGSNAATTHRAAAPAKRSIAMTYLPPTLLDHLLDSGMLARSIIDAIRRSFPNVSASMITSLPTTTATSAVKATNATTTAKPCQALMQFSAGDQQCIYSPIFYVVILSPSAVLLIIIVVVFSVCTFKRRNFRRATRQQLTALERRAPRQDNFGRHVFEHGLSDREAASSASKAESLHETADNRYANMFTFHETADSHYVNMSTVRDSREPAGPIDASYSLKLSADSRCTYVDPDQYIEPSTVHGASLHVWQTQYPDNGPRPQQKNLFEPDSYYENGQQAADTNITFVPRDDRAATEDESLYESIT